MDRPCYFRSGADLSARLLKQKWRGHRCGSAGSASGGELPHSRAATVLLDSQAHVATLVESISQPEGQVAGCCGNAQTTNSGNLLPDKPK